MEDYEARPCPSCGSRSLRFTKGAAGEPSFVSCTECGLEGLHSNEGLLEAISLWNTISRPDGMDIEAEVEELRAKVEALGRVRADQAREIRRLKADARASAQLADELSNRMDSIRASLPLVEQGEALVLDYQAFDLLCEALSTRVMVPWRSVGRLPEFARVEEIEGGAGEAQ